MFTKFFTGFILLAQAIGTMGSLVPIVFVNDALCNSYPHLTKLQACFQTREFLVAKWKLSTYAELIDGTNEYLVPRIEAFKMLSKNSILKVNFPAVIFVNMGCIFAKNTNSFLFFA